MATERGTRKLAAIMFTDIKSFSKKMSESEELAMQLLRIHDDTLKETVEKHDGKIIKAIGDAFMVDFSSAVNAVKCAIESQERFYEYNQGKTELEKLEIRIGIHLGDVISDGNDIFGDGVNIAARIEAVTEPTRICISQDVYSQVKNKMPIGTYHMGSISLKNIPEPVEVYEILIESIPEFATPSKTAQQMPNKRTAEKTTKREAKEAEKVEAAKKKAEEDRLKAEQETEQKVLALYEKSESLLREGKLDEAERELNEIFKFVAFHAGAQQLQSKIEDTRQKKAEEERKKAASLHKIKQQVGNFMEEALKMVADGNFEEAKIKVREIYEIDPENEEAKKLEADIAEGEKKKAESAAVAPPAVDLEEEEETEESEDLVEEEIFEEPGAEIEEETEKEPVVVKRKPKRARRRPRRDVGLKAKRKKLPLGLIKAVAVLVLVGAVYALWPTLEKVFFPPDTTIVVVPFALNSQEVDTAGVGDGLANILADDLSRYAELVVIRPGNTDGRRMDPLQTGRQVQAHYVLSGTILSLYPTLSINMRLSSGENGSVLTEWTVDSEPFSLMRFRSASVTNVLLNMEINTESKNLLPTFGSPDGTEKLFYAMRLTSKFDRESVARGITLLQQLASEDPAASVYTTLGRALLREYKIQGEWDKSLLRDAVDAALKARALSPNLPAVYEVLGTAYTAAGRYDPAEKTLNQALEFQPDNAQCWRQMALLSIMEGDYDRALIEASKASLLDPRNPDSEEMMGHVHFFKQQYSSAEQSYNNAVALGASSYLITTRYKLAVWGAGLSPQPVVQYCGRLLQEDTTNFVLKYWIGRAYMLSGIWTEAKKYLEPGAEWLKHRIELNPNDVAAHSYLALYYARLGEPGLGASEADKAIALGNESVLPLYRKAQFLAIQTDKKAQALAVLSRAVQQEYILWEVMSPDFAFIAKEPDFRRAVSINPRASAPAP